MDEDDVDAVHDLIDDIEIGLDDREARLAAYDEALRACTNGSRAWAEILVVAADHRRALGQHELALAHLEEVRAAGVDLEPSIEARLLSAHLEAGDEAEVERLDRELRARSREWYLGEDYNWVGESYEMEGRLQEALRWFSMANREVDPDDVDMLEPLALTGRWRVRKALDLPPDAYDEAAAIVHEEELARWEAAND